ncbi:MAG: hypothetical protein OH319_01585 [Candidatus Parvarchaeota archaeon]|nr:hypothetical protein [Candidatus Jingweiarchaeum tengchongense]MCW1297737.1 hypothetical protein [Candidatus Jingweiarchaeum tengchongense]MCW1299747.1 hypothetical protein [Candidatus Jingweiarchaeum tengchongense]MCW1304282.1 hypothetical protein [Candidatus Jingweiarchaeum tengchongense]MCW1305309.1 hypothetical protein [Candidatus Jingweiarchaeum tengchongense]
MKKGALQHFIAIFIIAVIALLLLLFYIIPAVFPMVPSIGAPICATSVCLRTLYTEARAKTFTIPIIGLTVASARQVLFVQPPSVRSICPYGTGQMITNTSGRIIKYSPTALECDITKEECRQKLENKTIKKIIDDINTCWGIFKTCGQDPLMEEPNIFYFCSSVYYELGNLNIFYRWIYEQMDVNRNGSLQNKTGKDIPIKIFKYGGEYVPHDSFDLFNQRVIIHTVFMDYGAHACQYDDGECNSTLTAGECLAKIFGGDYDNALYNYRKASLAIPTERGEVETFIVMGSKCRKMVTPAWQNYPPKEGAINCYDGASLERFYIGSWGIPIRYTKPCWEPDGANLCDDITNIPFQGCKDQIWLIVQPV